MFLSEASSGEESASRFSHVVGRTCFLVVVGLTAPPLAGCWLPSGPRGILQLLGKKVIWASYHGGFVVVVIACLGFFFFFLFSFYGRTSSVWKFPG